MSLRDTNLKVWGRGIQLSKIKIGENNKYNIRVTKLIKNIFFNQSYNDIKIIWPLDSCYKLYICHHKTLEYFYLPDKIRIFKLLDEIGTF